MTKEIERNNPKMPPYQEEVVIYNNLIEHIHHELVDRGIVESNAIPDAETLPGNYPTKDLPTPFDNPPELPEPSPIIPENTE